MEVKLQISGMNALAFFLMTIASLFLFVSFESSFWAEVTLQDDQTTMAVGIWQLNNGISIPSDQLSEDYPGTYRSRV